MFSDELRLGLDDLGVRFLGSCDAGGGDAVDESGCTWEDGLRESFFGSGGRDESYPMEGCILGEDAKFLVFFRGQVDNDEGIDAYSVYIFEECCFSVGTYGVRVSHEYKGREGSFFSYFLSKA